MKDEKEGISVRRKIGKWGLWIGFFAICFVAVVGLIVWAILEAVS